MLSGENNSGDDKLAFLHQLEKNSGGSKPRIHPRPPTSSSKLYSQHKTMADRGGRRRGCIYACTKERSSCTKDE